MAKPKPKFHEADQVAAAEIAAATEFSVFMLVKGERIVRRPIPTLREAVIAAREIEGQHPNKRALIYALVPGAGNAPDHDQPIPRAMREAIEKEIDDVAR
jgi:hypothetical protein